MVKISILYPKIEDTRFDMDYYLDIHMPMSIGHLSEAPGYRGVAVAHGVDVGVPGVNLSYVASCDYLFDTFEDFLAAFTPHAELLQGDIANYTNVEPLVQVYEMDIYHAG